MVVRLVCLHKWVYLFNSFTAGRNLQFDASARSSSILWLGILRVLWWLVVLSYSLWWHKLTRAWLKLSILLLACLLITLRNSFFRIQLPGPWLR